MVDPPGVVTGRYGTIGELFFLAEPYWPLNTTLYVRDFHGNSPIFIYYHLQQFDFDIFSGKSGVPGVNRNDLHSELVSLPLDVEEQRAIAAALSDIDALLDGLDRLIAKKRDLKQATMQQLLTGQTRLPGFSGEWQEVRLADIAEFCAGTYLAQEHYRDGPYDVQGAGASMGCHDVANIAKPLSVVGGVGTIGKPRFFSTGCWVNNNAAALVARSNAVPEYVHLLLLSLDWRKVVSVTAQPFLVVPDLMNTQFRVPSRDEQAAIAAVLSDVDTELATLQARREKTKNLKKAMMQELLTGKTRLLNGAKNV
jgi:type I restriction enzyme S subunit